ncbi:putative F-box/FBD/LRR-repeat protein-like isoform X1 [Capsicum annuum]|nr:putative F-box/FBD/LRR-repeat protein-like isoform X1 [Capsicum annuum]
MDPPSTFKGFNKLISLELYLVTMSTELLKNLESHCPLLEKLVWFRLDDGDSVDSNAPMLKSFDFTGIISSIYLKNVPRLLKVSLTGFDMSAQHLDFAKVFKSCPALEHLLINFNFAVYSAKDDNRILESLELEHFSDMALNYLREVELKCYAGTPREMQLIKLLLAKSPVLVKMLIDRRSGLLETRVNLFDEVSSFILASPKAEDFDIYFLLMNEFSNVSFLSHSDARYVAVMNSIFSAQHIMLLGDYCCMMPPTGRECRQGLPPDVLNDLLDNVIDIIVMSLPFKDAVRTSVLARKWKYLWCRHRSLKFDDSIWRTREIALAQRPYKFSLVKECLVSLLAKVSLICEGSYMEAERFDYAKFFESCSALEHLSLNFGYSEFLADEAPTRLPFYLNRVKHFHLAQPIVVMESYKLSFALFLIRSFPYLEYLNIVFELVMEADDRGIQESLELERFSDVTFNHLREVTLAHFGGTTPEMQLIKLLLAKSLVLVKVQIYPALYVDSSSDTLAEILKFRHASPKVEIDYVLGDFWYMMPPKGRKHCRSLTPGVLSNLPDNVIDVILMCLPCKDAVRTSILSKKWRYRWCRLTELTLDSSIWKAQDLLNPTVKFTKVIYQLLSLHEGPITKFTLNMANLEKTCPTIDNVIYFLSRNQIQDLVLIFPWHERYKLPSSFFKCLQLRHLILNHCSIHPPSVFQGFARLTSLVLYEVLISSELLESLISHSPLLEQLVLSNLEILNTIEIDAPMLRSFDFEGDISSICLKNVPLLFFAEEGYETPTRLPYDLAVKQFHLVEIKLVDSYMLANALCLIRSFPCLESLEIQEVLLNISFLYVVVSGPVFVLIFISNIVLRVAMLTPCAFSLYMTKLEALAVPVRCDNKMVSRDNGGTDLFGKSFGVVSKFFLKIQERSIGKQSNDMERFLQERMKNSGDYADKGGAKSQVRIVQGTFGHEFSLRRMKIPPSDVPKNKSVRTWPKADNIILMWSFDEVTRDSNNWYQSQLFRCSGKIYPVFPTSDIKASYSVVVEKFIRFSQQDEVEACLQWQIQDFCSGGSIYKEVYASVSCRACFGFANNNLMFKILQESVENTPLMEGVFAVRMQILGYYWYMMPPKERKRCRRLTPDVFLIMQSMLTELTLDSSLWKARDLLDPTVKFTKVIYQLLSLHEGPITKFTLNTAFLKITCPTIDNVIYFLSKNQIQDLVLIFPWHERYKLPSSFFTCSQLRHLILHHCSIHPPPAFQGFDRLTNLVLCEVSISSELLESLISNCPLLEELVLSNPEILNTVEIDACLKNVPLLVKVSLEGDYMKAEDLDFAKIFESCSFLEFFTLNFFSIKFFAEEGYETPTRLPYDLAVKQFHLLEIKLVNSYMLANALCLIRSFPYLESLEILAYGDAKDDHILESLELEHLSDVTFNHLKEVKLECFSSTMPEMQLIKLLLAKPRRWLVLSIALSLCLFCCRGLVHRYNICYFMLLHGYCNMKPPKGRRHCRSLTPDVISDLPDNVIDVILLRLPCKDAVRTSILSKKWRYHWCRLKELTLDSSLRKTKKDLLNCNTP